MKLSACPCAAAAELDLSVQVPKKSPHRSLQSPVRQQHALQEKVAELAGELAACQGKYRVGHLQSLQEFDCWLPVASMSTQLHTLHASACLISPYNSAP